MIRYILRPDWVFRGVKRDRRMYKPTVVCGADTETVHGDPYTYQLVSPDAEVMRRVSGKSITEKFFNDLLTLPSGAVVYLHNLSFDLPVLFYPFIEWFSKERAFVLEDKGVFRADIWYDPVCFADLRIEGKSYRLIDTFAFFKASLKSLAKRFGFPMKLRKPRKLGSVRYTGTEWDYFKRYAMQDARIARWVGEKIEAFHQGYDVARTISAPQLSARIFKRRFVPVGSVLPSNPKACDEAACLSYHGGKNGLYVAPGVYRDVKVYDINSAYPFAFTRLPNFNDCSYRWSRKVRGPGIVCISGVSRDSLYNPLRDHSFKAVLGPFTRLWVTTPELQTLERHGYLERFTVEEAWEVRSNGGPNPLADFAVHFFERKQQETGTMREFYKIVLNSLYGKFVQNIQGSAEPDFEVLPSGKLCELPRQFQAGGLWNPLLGSLITGYVRAYLTELEIKAHSLHSSTDSIMSTRALPCGDKLGDLTMQCRGTALLLRPKLYVVWDGDGTVTHYALHGFHGNLAQFISLMRSGKRTYAHTRMRKIREAAKTHKKPLIFERFFKRINVPIEGPLDIPRLTWEGRAI